MYLLPAPMVMASVAARWPNSTFFWLAKSATARPTLERKVPARKDTFSRVSSSSATRTASLGVAPSSRNTISLRPHHAALGVDLLLRQLHAVAVGRGEHGHAAIGVELADLDRLALRRGGAGANARPDAASAIGTIHRTILLPYMPCAPSWPRESMPRRRAIKIDGRLPRLAI